MKKFVIDITETGRSSLREPAENFNLIVKRFETKEELIQYLIERYGKLPNMKRKIYYDSLDKATLEKTPHVCGFIHSYWNQDVSHNSKKWFQTDWVCYYEKEEEIKPFKLKEK